MAQARRKTSRRSTPSRDRRPIFSGGIGTLITGIVIGVLGSTLYFGLNNDSPAVGGGLKNLWEVSTRPKEARDVKSEAPADLPKPPSAKFDFYTILPEIERVIPDSVPSEVRPEREAEPDPDPGVMYMLQAGSYANFGDADRLKARLALAGLSAHIQKVAIEGRGTFHRVRLGPFVNQASLNEVNARLKREGIEAIRLRISG